MELTYHGGNCIKLKTKHATVVVDDTLQALGLKSIVGTDDIVLQTFSQDKPATDVKMLIDSPGEYEVSDISIVGVPAQSHMGDKGTFTATIYKIIAHDISIAFIGHIFEEITDDEIEELGHVDVLVVPIGGHGYTLDGEGALKVVRRIEPKLVIPTHYADKDVNYEVPQTDLDEALKNMSMEVSEKTPKLKLKASDLPEILRLIVLEKQ